METRNDLPAETRRDVAENLNHVLAIISDLYSQTKQAHWNVRGPQFYMQHKLFDEVAETVEEHIDTLAERVVQLGFKARGTVRQAATESSLPEFPTEQRDDLDFTHALADRFSQAATETRKAIDDCEVSGDADSADILTQISRDLDKSLWFLEAQFRPIGDGSQEPTADNPRFPQRSMQPARR
jgi:starvation-inducible DNA-binding protein